MEKEICDICGKEITNNLGLHGMSYSLWGIIYSGHISKDFCSPECLVKYVKENIEKKKDETDRSRVNA